jgi:hypothetical protein
MRFDRLTQTSLGRIEHAPTVLGKPLRAGRGKPSGSGRWDSTWCWQDQPWLGIEAKSDGHPTRMTPRPDISPAGDQLRLLCDDLSRGASPLGSATIIISPKPAIDSDAIKEAKQHVRVVSADVVSDLAEDASAAWDDILGNLVKQSGTSLRCPVTGALGRHSVLPTLVMDRLTHKPVVAASAAV